MKHRQPRRKFGLGVGIGNKSSMKQHKRTLGALVLTGVTLFGSFGFAAAPARADGTGAAIIGAIVGYGLYKAGKDDA